MSIIPKQYTVILKDNNGRVIDYIDDKIDQLGWEWSRIGGCGACRLQVKTEWDSALASSFSEDYEIDIYAPSSEGTAELWYSGYVDKVQPKISGRDEVLRVNCLGYVNQLKRAVVKDQYYNGVEISQIVKSIAEVYATGITNITTTASDFEDTKFSADSVYFDDNAYEAIKRLADIAGKREWGVRADKSLFFLTRDTNITRRYNITEDFISFNPSRDYNPLITKIFLIGGEGYNGEFTVTNKITTREKIVTNSTIVTQSVGQQYARMYLKEHGRIRRSYTAKLADNNVRLESTIPLGKASVNVKNGIRVRYDIATQLYDSGLKYDGGTESFQIEKIKYTLRDNKFDVTLNFGPVPPTIVDDMERFEFALSDERNR